MLSISISQTIRGKFLTLIRPFQPVSPSIPWPTNGTTKLQSKKTNSPQTHFTTTHLEQFSNRLKGKRKEAAAAASEKKMYVVGGYVDDVRSAMMEELDYKSGSEWKLMEAQMPNPRWNNRWLATLVFTKFMPSIHFFQDKALCSNVLFRLSKSKHIVFVLLYVR